MEIAESKLPEVMMVDDGIFFSVRAESILKKLGYAIKVISDSEKAMAYAQERPLAIAIVNFNSERLKPAALVEHLKSLKEPPQVIGFVAHIWLPQVRPAAMAAGCDLLVANSAMAMRLPQLVEKLAPKDGSLPKLEEAAYIAGVDQYDV